METRREHEPERRAEEPPAAACGAAPESERRVSLHVYQLVVGFDLSELGELALDMAIRFAAPHEGSEVHALFVERAWPSTGVGGWDVPLQRGEEATRLMRTVEELEARADKRLDEVRARLPEVHCTVRAHARSGAPAAEIVRFAAEREADLIVVGTHGRTGLKRLVLGSVAEEVVRTAPCAVFVARHKTRRPEAERRPASGDT
jgi:nucleotide-binding universal stress UspA family protein